MTRRHQRHPVLSPNDTERFYRDSMEFRGFLINLQIGLNPHGAHYRALNDLTDALHKALAEIAARKLEFRKSDLGLLE